MNTKFYSKYRRTLAGVLLAVALLGAGGAYFGVLYLNSRRADAPPAEPVRREGCVCPLDRNLPVMAITTNGQDVNVLPERVEAEVYGTMMKLYLPSTRYAVDVSMFEPGDYGYTCTCGAATPTLVRTATISLRGQSSLVMDKKQYTLNFVDDEGNAQPLPLLGMPSHHQWVLNGSYADRSLLRNALAYTMAAQTMDYAPRFEYCEVLLNLGEGRASFDEHYIGVYLLLEKIERGPDRVDIKKADERYSDLSFIIARDKIKAGDEIFYTDWGSLEDEWIVGDNGQLRQRTVLTGVYPGASMTSEYRTRIIDYIDDFEYALGSKNFDNPSSGYRQYVDVDSFIELAMVNEVFKNVDGGEVSTYFYKDLGGKLKAGPAWDFDLTLGNTSLAELREPTGLRMIDVNWYSRLFQDDYFADKYEHAYHQLREDEWSNESILALVGEQQARLGAAAQRNTQRWYSDPEKHAGYSYDAEVAEMEDFLITRLEWMDRNVHLVHRINGDTD